METRAPPSRGRARSNPLETSLVEWKLGSAGVVPPARPRLGNFLSGMETLSDASYPGTAETPWKLP